MAVYDYIRNIITRLSRTSTPTHPASPSDLEPGFVAPGDPVGLYHAPYTFHNTPRTKNP